MKGFGLGLIVEANTTRTPIDLALVKLLRSLWMHLGNMIKKVRSNAPERKMMLSVVILQCLD